MFRLSGLQRVGCFFVPRFSRSIGLLEGQTPDLSDDPLARIDPIRKCGTGAQQFNYRLFAVSAGYCISGSNRQSDYTAGTRASNLCSNGVGNVVNGNFLMDVYEIQDPEAFRNSVAQITATTSASVVPPTDSAGGDLIVDNGAPSAIKISYTLLLSLTFLTIISLLIFVN